MIHIAIMNSRLGLIDKIVSGEKTIESRWYKYRMDPWNKIKVGEKIYFKDTGALVTAMAEVDKVEQYADLEMARHGCVWKILIKSKSDCL